MSEYDIIVNACSTRKERGLTWDELRLELNEILGWDNLTPRTYQHYWKQHEQVLQVDDTLDLIYKETVKSRDRARINTERLRDTARMEVILDAYREGRTDSFPVFEIVSTPKGHNKAVIAVNDWHVGANHKNYLGEYSVDIMRDYIEIYLNRCIADIELFNVDEVLILNLGDLIEGNIHVSTRIQAELDAVEQSILASELLANFIGGIYTTGVKVNVGMVLDNHSRIHPNKKDAIEKESFGLLVGEMAKLRLMIDGCHDDINWIDNEIDNNIGFAHFNGLNIGWVHGHLDDPKNSNAKLDKLLGVQIDILYSAHYHHLMMKDNIIQCPAMIPSSEYAMDKRLSSRAGQLMTVFDGETQAHMITYF